MKYEADMRDSLIEGIAIGKTEEREIIVNSFYTYLNEVGYSLEKAILFIEETCGIPKSEIQKIISNKVAAWSMKQIWEIPF